MVSHTYLQCHYTQQRGTTWTTPFVTHTCSINLHVFSFPRIPRAWDVEVTSNVRGLIPIALSFLRLSSKVNNSVIYAGVILVSVYLLIVFEVRIKAADSFYINMLYNPVNMLTRGGGKIITQAYSNCDV